MNKIDPVNFFNWRVNVIKMRHDNDYIPHALDDLIVEINAMERVCEYEFSRNQLRNHIEKRLNNPASSYFAIKKVHFNPPVTVVIWEDGTKTIVRTQGEDRFDPEKGLAMAISKKVLGNNGGYYDEFKKWLDPYQEELDELNRFYSRLFARLNYNADVATKAMKKISDIINKTVDTEEPNYTEDGE